MNENDLLDAKIAADILVVEHLASHFKNVNYVSWEHEIDLTDWQIHFKIAISTKRDEIVLESSTDWFNLLDGDFDDRLIINLRATRERLFRRLRQIFRAKTDPVNLRELPAPSLISRF